MKINGNIIGGYGSNLTGSTKSSILGGENNAITAGTYNVIGGGLLNETGSATTNTFIGAGENNKAKSNWSVIAGGKNNTIKDNSHFGFIGAGSGNTINNAPPPNENLFATILNGENNFIDHRANYATILGGFNNIVSGDTNDSKYVVIVNGVNNLIIDNLNDQGKSMTHSTILNGESNIISGQTTYSTILYGSENKISGGDNIAYRSLLGGSNSQIFDSSESIVLGGTYNLLYNATHGVILGGTANTIRTSSLSAIISSRDSIISGGTYGGNVILGGAQGSGTFTNALIGASNSAIIGGKSITGTTSETVYVPNFETRGGSVFNQDGGNFDFRVEGDTNTHLVFVDASTDRVGINNSAPDSKLSISTLEGDGISFDGMTDASLVGKHKFYTKQGETGTTGTNTSTIATIPLVSGDRITLRGIITGIGTGSLVVGGTFSAVGDNTAGTASIIGSVDTSVKSANSIGSPTFTVTASGGNILIRVTGGGENTQWVATYEYQIVSAPVG